VSTAELIVLCRRQLAKVEELCAKGVDESSAYEIAAFVGIARRLHWAAEDEYREYWNARNRRGVERRERVAEVMV
jgi:hypothetical protein